MPKYFFVEEDYSRFSETMKRLKEILVLRPAMCNKVYSKSEVFMIATLWDVNRVARALKENNITENEKVRAFVSLTFLLWLCVPELVNLDWIEIPISYGPGFFITFFGIFWCIKANSQGDARDFITRMVFLALPIGIRVLLVGLIVGLAIAIIPESTLVNLFGKKYHPILVTVCGIVCNTTFFVWMHSYILDVSNARK